MQEERRRTSGDRGDDGGGAQGGGGATAEHGGQDEVAAQGDLLPRRPIPPVQRATTEAEMGAGSAVPLPHSGLGAQLQPLLLQVRPRGRAHHCQLSHPAGNMPTPSYIYLSSFFFRVGR